MNADDFATQLAAFAPAAPAWMATYGMSAADAERSRAGYFCRRISPSDEADPLLYRN
jgi:hypothetical protein